MTMKWSASFAMPLAIRSAIIASATAAVWAKRIWATAAAAPCAASSLAKRVSRVRLIGRVGVALCRFGSWSRLTGQGSQDDKGLVVAHVPTGRPHLGKLPLGVGLA